MKSWTATLLFLVRRFVNGKDGSCHTFFSRDIFWLNKCKSLIFCTIMQRSTFYCSINKYTRISISFYLMERVIDNIIIETNLHIFLIKYNKLVHDIRFIFFYILYKLDLFRNKKKKKHNILNDQM